MAGIYVHIPFCKQACSYCNFHFSTSLQNKDALIDAIVKELWARREELNGEEIRTVYFGGGTPSLLSAEELMRIYSAIEQAYSANSVQEITLEANPDDINLAYAQRLYDNTPINRLSLGIQSFVEADLRFMHRAHSAEEAWESLRVLQGLGRFSLSVDLIYGSPFLSDTDWVAGLERVLSAGVEHLSCYALTVEEKTALAHQIRKKISPPLEEERAAKHFELLLGLLPEYGYEQYEISNFCREEAYAMHNTGYWKGEKYIGVGAAAHSFDGQKRRWNIANNPLYIKGVGLGAGYWEEEVLTEADVFNEYLLTGFRTKWGVEKNRMQGINPTFFEQMRTRTRKYLHQGLVLETDTGYLLSDTGKLLGDKIIGDLFV